MKAMTILTALHVVNKYVDSDPECNIAVTLVGKQFDLEAIAPKIQKKTGVVFTRLVSIAGEGNVDNMGNVHTYNSLLPELQAEVDELHKTLDAVLSEEYEFELDILEESVTPGKSVSAYRDMRRLCKKS